MTPAAKVKAELIAQALAGPVPPSSRRIAEVLAMLTSVYGDEREKGKKEVRRLVQEGVRIEAQQMHLAMAVMAADVANRFEP